MIARLGDSIERGPLTLGGPGLAVAKAAQLAGGGGASALRGRDSPGLSTAATTGGQSGDQGGIYSERDLRDRRQRDTPEY